jgi:hypothetical protein
MQKILIGLLSVTTIALAVLCVVQNKQLREAREQTRVTEELRAAEAEAQETQVSRLKELERANARLDQQVQKFAAVTTSLRTNEAMQRSNITAWAERMKSGEGAAGEEGEGGGVFGKGMGEMLSKMMKDPAMREMMREQQKAAINMMYSGLFKEMKLSPEEKEKLRELLTESQMRNIESAQGLMGGEKLDATAEAAATKALEDAKKQTDADVKALLGDERYAQFDDYQKNMGERMQLDQFKTQLAADNLTLRDDQTSQLMQIMKEEKAALPPAIPTDQSQVPKKEMFTAENLDKQLKWMDDYNQRVLQRAGQVLSPEQLTQYQKFQEQQISMQKLGLQMAKQMFGSDKGGTGKK